MLPIVAGCIVPESTQYESVSHQASLQAGRAPPSGTAYRGATPHSARIVKEATAWA